LNLTDYEGKTNLRSPDVVIADSPRGKSSAAFKSREGDAGASAVLFGDLDALIFFRDSVSRASSTEAEGLFLITSPEEADATF
jgi:hypothetical protein